MCQSSAAERTSYLSFSCVASAIWAAAAPAADPGEKRAKIATVMERVVIEDLVCRASLMCWRLPEPTDCVFGRRLRNGTFGGSAAAACCAAGRRSERHHHVGADGMLTTNRRGRKLCQKWQEGQCEPFRVANARVTEALCG